LQISKENPILLFIIYPHTDSITPITTNNQKEDIHIDTSKLKKGQTFKNYKELCSHLNEPVKAGNSKKVQLENWEVYFLSSKSGHKIVIEQIYKKPKGKMSRYGLINEIEELVLDLLVQDDNKGEVFLSKIRLFRSLNMINDNYNYGRYHIPKLSLFTEISEKEIHEFYDLSKESLARSVENALTRLRKKSLVYWSAAMTICILNTNIESNQSGDAKASRSVQGLDEYGSEVYDYDINYNIRHVHREATKEEIQAVLSAERKIMDELKCNDKSEVIRRNLWNDFSNKVKNLIFDSHNILYYYDSYKITCNEDFIYTVWSDLNELSLTNITRNKKYINLNNSIKHKLLENAEKRQAKALEHNLDDSDNIRLNDAYLSNSQKLIDNLVDMGAKNIKPDIKKINIHKGFVDKNK